MGDDWSDISPPPSIGLAISQAVPIICMCGQVQTRVSWSLLEFCCELFDYDPAHL